MDILHPHLQNTRMDTTLAAANTRMDHPNTETINTNIGTTNTDTRTDPVHPVANTRMDPANMVVG